VSGQSNAPSAPSRTATAKTRCQLGIWERRDTKWAIFSLGGQAALEKPSNEGIAVPIIERSLDLGVNYIDTSSIYGGPDRWGASNNVGKVMNQRPQAPRSGYQNERADARWFHGMIETSLSCCDRSMLDLWQLHDIGTMTDINEIFSKGGAMEAPAAMRAIKKLCAIWALPDTNRPDR